MYTSIGKEYIIYMEKKLIEKTESYEVYDIDGKVKSFRSENFNYDFRYSDGVMLSWGKTFDEDPIEAPAPIILDMEVTTICRGGCKFCYKANTMNGKNMTLDTFKHIIDIYPKSLTQIALGADYDLSTNPWLFDMMDYARSKNIIPNITAGFISDEKADELAKRVGAVAVSCYDIDKCADSVKRMTDRGIIQTNIHYMIAEETYWRAFELIDAIKKDARFSKLNALVFLSLKTKGRAENGFTPLSQEKFNNLVKYAIDNKVRVGFDSCSSLKAYRAFDALGMSEVQNMIIPCEASTESSYINVDGKYYPCSFCEGENNNGLDWTDGIDVTQCKTTEEFLDKVWNNERTKAFKACLGNTCNNNSEGCKNCPMFKV